MNSMILKTEGRRMYMFDVLIRLIPLAFTFGLTIGSFLNVVIYRMPLGKKLTGRSQCPTCNHTLSPIELVPVFSYLGQGRKCKSCGEKISPRYMSVELLTAVLFAVYTFILTVYGQHSLASVEWTINLFVGFLITSTLISMAFIDIDTMEIPDRFHVILIVSAIILTITNGGSLTQILLSGLKIGVPMFILAFITLGLGLGDVKLLFASGMLFGAYKTTIGILVGSVSAIIYGLVAKLGRKEKFPFGPHLALGMYVALLITVGGFI